MKTNHQIDRMSVALGVAVVLVTGAQVVDAWIQLLHPQAAKLPSVILVGLWIVDLLRTRAKPVFCDTSYLATGLLLVVLISGAAHAGQDGVLLSVMRWVPFLVTLVVLVDVMARRVSPLLGLVGMAAGATAAGVGAVVSFAFLGAPRATGPMEDPNDLAYVLTAAIPVLLVGIAPKGRRAGGLRLLCWLATLVCLTGAAATLSRGGALAVAVLVAWAFCRRLIPLQAAVWGLTAAIGTAASAALFLGDKISAAMAQKSYIASYNVETRALRWEAALRGFSHSPLLGMGPGGAAVQYGMNSNFAEMDTPTAATHNMYIEVGADLGIIGLFLFMALIFAVFRHTWSARGANHRLELACEGSLLAICTSSFFLSEQYYMPLWATISVASALAWRRSNHRGVTP